MKCQNVEQLNRVFDAKLEKFTDEWTKLNSVINRNDDISKECEEKINFIITGNSNKYILDAGCFNFKIPDYLMLEYGHTIKNVS